MAVKPIGSTNTAFTGFSTDEKPVDRPVNGATFLAVDTFEQWIFHDGMWVLDPRTAYLKGRIISGVL